VNTGGVVSRSDIVLGQPNTADSQFLPLHFRWRSHGTRTPVEGGLVRPPPGPPRLGAGQVHLAVRPCAKWLSVSPPSSSLVACPAD
jgi:hypothetical protein